VFETGLFGGVLGMRRTFIENEGRVTRIEAAVGGSFPSRSAPRKSLLP
jgi:hypothetical protein